MTPTRTRITMAVLLTALATGACATTGGGAPEQPRRRPAMSEAEIEALYEARADSARQRFTQADVRFMTGMMGHHAQAIVMARLAPTHGASPEIRTLAARIINAQEDEIALMRQWLRDRGQPVPEIHIEGLMVHGPEHAMNMPGMLTDAQLRELDAARGAEFDRLLLTYMIQHHRGAVEMVHELFATDGAAQDEGAFRLASDVQVDQITEISRMESMLARMRREGPQ